MKSITKEKDPVVKKMLTELYVEKWYKKDVPKYKKLIERFVAEKGHEPTALDYDNTDYLPSSRTLQRKFGGLPRFRELANLNTINFTKGSLRAEKAKKSMDDCLQDETKLFELLVKKYGLNNVSTPAKIFAFRGLTADIRLDIGDTVYLIDVFKPNSTHSFMSCINIKNKKYLLKGEVSMYPENKVEFIYVCVNDEVMIPVKNVIPVLSLPEFQEKFITQYHG